MKLKINEKAPDFKLKNQDAKEVRLSDFNNKWLLVYFYPKDNTPGCTKEACGMRDYQIRISKSRFKCCGD